MVFTTTSSSRKWFFYFLMTCLVMLTGISYARFELGFSEPIKAKSIAASPKKQSIGTQKVSVDTIQPCGLDTIRPVFENCPLDTLVTISATSTDTCFTHFWHAPTAFDNCSTPSVTGTHQAGFCFPIGETTIIYTATDISGNTATCSFKMTVQKATNPCAGDTIRPVLSPCPKDTIITVGNTMTCLPYQFARPTATDNCGVPTVVGTRQSGSCFPVGQTTVTFTATDNNRNTATCAFRVTIRRPTNPCDSDRTKPIIERCPLDTTIYITSTSMDSCRNFQWAAPFITDNCSVPNVAVSHPNGSCFPVGMTTVTYIATDTSRNSATCSFNITVIKSVDPCAGDTIKPFFERCPKDTTLYISQTSLDTCRRVLWATPLAFDNCGIPAIQSSHRTDFCFPKGTTPVTYYATDSKGLTTVCSFTVTIVRPTNPCDVDTIKPILSACPTGFNVRSDSGCAVVRWSEPAATDNCGIPVLQSSHQRGACFPLGTTTVRYTATDAKGNTATCAFTITVQNPCFNDTIKPIIQKCPVSQTLTTADTCMRAYWSAPIASDNCGTVNLTSTHQSGMCFRIGTTDVVYVASDRKGNSARCVFAITVLNPCFTDTIKPRITCPSAINFTTTDTCARLTWNIPRATDNCTSVPTVSGTHQPGSCFPIGTTTVTYTATDAKRNTGTCSFNVTVAHLCANDTIKPRISGCLDSIRLVTVDSCARATWNMPRATDNCGIPTLTASHQSGACFPIGTTSVIFMARDSRGNTSTCAYKITVVKSTIIAPCDTDRIAPVIRNCPTSITASTTNPSGMVITWTAPTATDNCSTPTLTSTQRPGNLFPIGTTAVVYTATDRRGNQALCSFVVVIRRDSVVTPSDTTKCYILVNRKSLKVLTIQAGAMTSGAKAIQFDNLNVASQKWKVRRNANGSVVLVAQHSGLVLNVVNSTSNGTPVVQSPFSATATSQTWTLSATNSVGYFKIKNLASQKLLTVVRNANWSGAPLEQRSDINSFSQEWKFVEVPCVSANTRFAAERVLSFDAYQDGGKARLAWVSKNDEKADYFIVEKAHPQTGEFEKIGIVDAQNGQTAHYSMIDNNPHDDENVYRIQVIRPNTPPQYSEVKIVNFEKNVGVAVYPNPATDVAHVDVSTYLNRKVDIAIFDIAGQLVHRESIGSATRSAHPIDISQLANGQYFIHIQADGKKAAVKKLVVLH
jgi:HYR domain/Secretion system C-terminal sorting domain/Ricin-type beta-trefoil lectin domain-like